MTFNEVILFRKKREGILGIKRVYTNIKVTKKIDRKKIIIIIIIWGMLCDLRPLPLESYRQTSNIELKKS